MASPRNRKRADGSVSFEALYRRDGKQASKTFKTAEGRDEWIATVDEFGLDAALEILASRQGKRSRVPTLAEYALADIELRSRLSEGGRDRHKREIAKDWGRMAKMPINGISEKMIREWVRKMQREGLAPKTIHNKHGFLSSVFNAAVRDSSIDLDKSPCANPDLPELEDEEMVFLTRDEFTVLLGCFPEPYRPFVHTLFMTGMRFSEITALRVEHYIPAPNANTPAALRVAQAWKKITGGWKLGPPKTRRGRRDIPIGPEVEADILRLITGKTAGDLIFTNARGGRIKHSTFYPDVWAPAVRLANGRPGWPEKGRKYEPSQRSMWYGIKPVGKALAIGKRPRIHDARHSAASWMIEILGNVYDVQQLLGHESIKTTADRYGHLVPARRQAIAAAMSVASSQARPQIEG